MATSPVEPVSRARPPEDGSERATLTGLLDYLRATVVTKVAGLTDDQASTRSAPPSALTPAGVVRHLTGVERFWFSIDFAGADVDPPWTTTTRTATSGRLRRRRSPRLSPDTSGSVSARAGRSRVPI
jgi:hypothetical protein